jgi:hypothetical protein
MTDAAAALTISLGAGTAAALIVLAVWYARRHK